MSGPGSRWLRKVPLQASPGSRLLDVAVELPEGEISMHRLTGLLKQYAAEVIMEHLKRLPDGAGVWACASVELQLLAPKEEAPDLIRDLQSLRDEGFRVTVVGIMTLEAVASEKDPRRRWVNG